MLKMRSFIGELVFGIGISIMAGSLFLILAKLLEKLPDMWGLYVSGALIFGIILVIIGASKIANDKINPN